jgi:hypothetical protein
MAVHATPQLLGIRIAITVTRILDYIVHTGNYYRRQVSFETDLGIITAETLLGLLDSVARLQIIYHRSRSVPQR